MPATELSDLVKGNGNDAIHVYVSRHWQHRGGTDDGPIKHTDLVFLDKQVLSSVFFALRCRLCLLSLPICSSLFLILGESHVWGDCPNTG
jgi:hypothetical protein